jgi:hypothetical protein
MTAYAARVLGYFLGLSVGSGLILFEWLNVDGPKPAPLSLTAGWMILSWTAALHLARSR